MKSAGPYNLYRRVSISALAGTAALLTGSAWAQTSPPSSPPSSGQSSSTMPSQPGKPDQATAMRMIEGWPETATKAAKEMMEKYGEPNEATPTRLIWFNNGPWKRTIVYKEEVQHDFPMPHKDVLEQVINLDVPADKFDDLAEYDGSVIVERTRGEISARCDKEGANILALNLAHDIIKGKKSVEEARQFYAKTMEAVMKGEKPDYTQKLQFEVPNKNVGDTDKAIMKKS